MNKGLLFRFIIVGMLSTLLIVAIGPASAQFRAILEVSPTWDPTTQLDTIDDPPTGVEDAGDDFRYVDVDLWVTSNVPFWAVDITCTVNKSVLGGYVWDEFAVTPQLGDDIRQVEWGNQWGDEGDDFARVPETFDAARGTLHFGATNLGWRHPLGGSGYEETFLLATMRFWVMPQTRNMNSTLTCRGNFVDRDGNRVTTARFNRPANLNVLTGYTISGNTQLQAQRNHANITVSCSDLINPAVSTLTKANGDWAITDLRNFGVYECLYWANIFDYDTDKATQGAEPFLAAWSIPIPLWDDSYQLLPIELFAGNTFIDGIGFEFIDFDDMAEVTAGFGTRPAVAYTGGDANGDRNVNEADLALVGGRYNSIEDIFADHILYDLSTDWSSDWNSHIQFGMLEEVDTTLMSDVRYKDYWATMSPDGSKIAFIRYDSRTDRYQLYTGTYKNGRLTAKLLTPRTFTMDAMAPAWSPDGNRIAFVCSDVWYDDRYGPGSNIRITDWMHDDSRLCIINADGKAFSELGGTHNARTYPPAWYDNHTLLFAANQWHWACPDSICSYDLNGNLVDQMDTNLDFTPGDDVADMPVIRDDVLFYRFISRTVVGGGGPDGNDQVTINSRNIRHADGITYGPGGFSVPAVGGTTHNNIVFWEDATGSTTETLNDIEYYTVERFGMNIIAYGQDTWDNNDWWYGWDQFISNYDADNDWEFTWFRSIERQNGFEGGDRYRDNGWWKCGTHPWNPYEPECESLGLRNTLEWLP